MGLGESGIASIPQFEQLVTDGLLIAQITKCAHSCVEGIPSGLGGYRRFPRGSALGVSRFPLTRARVVRVWRYRRVMADFSGAARRPGLRRTAVGKVVH